MGRLAWIFLLAGCNQAVGPNASDLPVQDFSVAERAKSATHLAFVEQPHSARADQNIGPVQVAALDDDGLTVSDFAGVVRLYLTANAGDLTLRGALLQTAVAGVARFDDLTLDDAGTALALSANSRSLGAAASDPFDVTAGAWSPVDTALDAGEVVRLFVDPVDATILYLATPRAGVFTSIDSGVSWRADNVALGDRRVRDLAMNGSGTLYAATASALYQRLRGSDTWNLIDVGDGHRDSPVTAVATRSSAVYAACAGDLLSSNDAGNTWSVEPTNADTAGAIRLAIAPDDAQVLFASDGATLVKSTDGGAHFARWMTGLAGAVRDLAFAADGTLYVATSAGAQRLLKDMTDWSALTNGASRAVAATASEVYIADESAGLIRWSAGSSTTLAAPPHPVPSALVLGAPAVYLGTTGGAAFRFDSGGWSFAGKNLSAARVTSLLAVSAGTLVCATSGGLFRSTDQAATWSAVTPGADPRFDLVASDGSNLFASSRGIAWRSSDGGAHFSAAPEFDGCALLRFDPADATVAWCAPFDSAVNGVYRIAMSGASRMLLQNGLAAHVDQLAIDATRVFAGTAAGLFASSDAGASFSLALPGATRAVTMATLLLASTENGAFSSADSGATWQPLALPATTAFFADPASGLYAAGERLYRSTDGGASWSLADSGLNGAAVTQLAFDPGKPLLVYAGSDGNGVFRANSGGQ